jgi:VIT1/CCC1 family predicted Fe2+/Mn2+ transporter
VIQSIKKGVFFGLTSGVITTLGLMVGLSEGTHSRLAVIGGICTIAIADALSDALGIHISEESENRHSTKEIWAATISTFLSKFLLALTFLIPVLLFSLHTAIFVGIAWGALVLLLLSYKMASDSGAKPWSVIAEHLLIAILVIIIACLTGKGIGAIFA